MLRTAQIKADETAFCCCWPPKQHKNLFVVFVFFFLAQNLKKGLRRPSSFTHKNCQVTQTAQNWFRLNWIAYVAFDAFALKTKTSLDKKKCLNASIFFFAVGFPPKKKVYTYLLLSPVALCYSITSRIETALRVVVAVFCVRDQINELHCPFGSLFLALVKSLDDATLMPLLLLLPLRPSFRSRTFLSYFSSEYPQVSHAGSVFTSTQTAAAPRERHEAWPSAVILSYSPAAATD